MEKPSEPTDSHLKCSFCGKAHDNVKKLIAGPGVYVCNECVHLCMEILKEEELEKLPNESISVQPIELNEGRRPDGRISEELQNLIADAGRAIQALIAYHRDAGEAKGGVELLLRTILYLRTIEMGRNSEELLPLLSELSAIYLAEEEYSTAAEITEWALAILENIQAPESTKRPMMLELIKLYVKTGQSSKAERWLNKLGVSVSDV